jgi:hypothetical protein
MQKIKENMWKKTQLDATEWFIANLLSAQHVPGTIMPIIRSSTLNQSAMYHMLQPSV